MIALKGKSDIGDKINTQVIQPLIDANGRLARSDFPDFNDPNKLGEGGAMPNVPGQGCYSSFR
jgi:type I restriction enzyme M protein